MAFGWDDALIAIFSAIASSAASSALQPNPQNELPSMGNPGQQPGQPPMTLPSSAGQSSPFLESLKGTGIQVNDELFTQAAQVAAQSGPPPTTPSQGAPTPPAPVPEGQTPPPAPAPPAPAPPAPPKQPSIGEILMASPQALASVADLLGLNQRDRTITAPVPGGTAGQVVQGFSLPQQNDIGQILAQLPRFM